MLVLFPVIDVDTLSQSRLRLNEMGMKNLIWKANFPSHLVCWEWVYIDDFPHLRSVKSKWIYSSQFNSTLSSPLLYLCNRKIYLIEISYINYPLQLIAIHLSSTISRTFLIKFIDEESRKLRSFQKCSHKC